MNSEIVKDCGLFWILCKVVDVVDNIIPLSRNVSIQVA
jgi:hypothetical protein